MIALGLLALAGCTRRTNAPSVHFAEALPAEEQWAEIPFRWRYTFGLPRYRSGVYDLTDVQRTRRRFVTDAKDFLRTRVERFDTTSYTFVVQEKGGLRSRVTAHFAHTSDMEHPVVIGSRVEGDRDIVLEETYSSRFEIIVDGDSAGRWTVEVISRAGQRVPDSLTYSARLVREGRALGVTFLTPAGPAGSRPVSQPAFWSGARGFLLLEQNRPLAAVQYVGSGILGGNDIRAWLPEGLVRRERLERTTLMMVMLVSSSRDMHTREHRVGN